MSTNVDQLMCLRFFLFTILFAPQLSAHDFWIAPSAYRAKAGQPIAVNLRVGEHFMGDPVPRMPQIIRRFDVSVAASKQQVSGSANQAPAGSFTPKADGIHLLAYESHGSIAQMTNDKFARYLVEEGLENRVSMMRVTGTSIRDRFARCAKALVVVGESSSGWDRRAGLTLELTPKRNPLILKKGSKLPVALTYRGKPLAGTLVVAMNRKSPARKLTARTNSAGEVTLTVDAAGEWLIKAVHLVPASDKAADYDSYWASLTFRNE